MQFPNGDLWTVRQVELLDGALEDMSGKPATYWPDIEYKLAIPGVAVYTFKGVLSFEQDDRTVMFEYGNNFGVSYDQVIQYLKKHKIIYVEKSV